MIYPLTFRYCHLLAQWSSSPSCGYPSALAQGVSITCCFLFFLPFLFFCVYVCMHTCVNVCGVIRIHKYVWMYMGGEEDVRCLPQSFPILFFEMTFYWTWSPWCVLASKPHTSTVNFSPVLRVQLGAAIPGIEGEFWGSELRFSCLYDKHVTNWAIYLDSCFYVLKYSRCLNASPMLSPGA